MPICFTISGRRGFAKALITHLADTITAQIGEAARRARAGDHDPREVVDLTFDAFARGAGAMASWMILTGNEDALDPILEAIHRLVDDLAAEPDIAGGKSIHEETLQLVLMALGDSLLGGPIGQGAGVIERDCAGACSGAVDGGAADGMMLWLGLSGASVCTLPAHWGGPPTTEPGLEVIANVITSSHGQAS